MESFNGEKHISYASTSGKFAQHILILNRFSSMFSAVLLHSPQKCMKPVILMGDHSKEDIQTTSLRKDKHFSFIHAIWKKKWSE